MTTHVLAGLVNRRAEAAGELEAARARVQALLSDLAALDAVIRQFDPDLDIAAIRPRRRRGDPAARGETCRAILDVLRAAAGPMTTAEVTARLAADRGLDVQGKRAKRRAVGRVGVALRRQRANGVVRSVPGAGQAVLWELAR